MSDEAIACSRGHRPSLAVRTSEGGSICLVCFSNLLSCPNSPSVHLCYAISQIVQALGDPLFVGAMRQFHAHFLVSSLVDSLSSRSDEEIGQLTIKLIADLSALDRAIARDFAARIADRLCSVSLTWGRYNVFTLHCLGMILDRFPDENPSTSIKDKEALVLSLVTGLRLPSDDIRGEIMFVLYKISILQEADDGELFFPLCPGLLYSALEALLKSQNDVVRINCIALLTVLACKGHFENSFANDQMHSNEKTDNLMKVDTTENSLLTLFADAIKGPLLSSDTQVQISTLDLIFHSLSSEFDFSQQIGSLIEEGVVDYVFEILRLAGDNDPLLQSCVRVLGLLATAEQAFKQRLVMGFCTLVRTLRYVVQIPLHAAQSQTIKLVLMAISNCPGVVSNSQVEELAIILTGVFKRHNSGQIGMLSETFSMACSTFGLLLEIPSSRGTSTIPGLAPEALRHAILPSLHLPTRVNDQLIYSLEFLKKTYSYCQENYSVDDNIKKMREELTELCEKHVLPSLGRFIDEGADEDVVLSILEIFQLVIQLPDNQSAKIVNSLTSSSFLSLAFGCLGVYPSSQVKEYVFSVLGLLAERILGHELGRSINEARASLPSDPLDLLFLLGQRSSNDSTLICCQSAIFSILYMSLLSNVRLADENEVLASMEQYLLVNSSNISSGLVHSSTLTQVVHLYSFFRGSPVDYQTPYCLEAEEILFQLMNGTEWDLFSLRIHRTSFMWLLQQDGLVATLSQQILNLCRCYSKSCAMNAGSRNEMMDINVLADLVASGDNSGGKLLVVLLKQFSELNQEDDIAAVMDAMTTIINMSPFSSNQFLLNGISYPIYSMYHATDLSPRILLGCSLLLFNILRSADSEILSDHITCLPLGYQLLNFLIPTLSTNSCNHEGHLIIGILTLMLHHSKYLDLTEVSKAIIFNPSLVSSINTIIKSICSRGPDLVGYDEETSMGKTMLLVIMMCCFSLRSLPPIVHDHLNWQDYIETRSTTSTLTVLCVHSQDLCRMIYFGSSAIKLVASQCLLELLTRILEQKTTKTNELTCAVDHLQSMISLLQGLVFHSDIRVAINCSLCLSTIVELERIGWCKGKTIDKDKWFRLIIEELTLLLAAPRLASKAFSNQHKPAVCVALALLRLEPAPWWMQSVFYHDCISVIIGNLSSSSLSAEIVQLFRELARSKYLNAEHITRLCQVFQAYRKHVYLAMNKSGPFKDTFEQVFDAFQDASKVIRILQDLMLASSNPLQGCQTLNGKLLEEIEGFLREVSS